MEEATGTGRGAPVPREKFRVKAAGNRPNKKEKYKKKEDEDDDDDDDDDERTGETAAGLEELGKKGGRTSDSVTTPADTAKKSKKNSVETKKIHNKERRADRCPKEDRSKNKNSVNIKLGTVWCAVFFLSLSQTRNSR